VFANEIPSLLEIFGAPGKLEVVDIHTEKQAEFSVCEDALPALQGLKSDLREGSMAMLLPKEAR
jgi:hypothetical protein